MSDTPSATERFTTPDPALAVGTTHQGFTVEAIEPLEELSGTAYVMRHDATSARLMWLATADTNRSFAIAFKTPPADDTGVFHILEHSVLCGSERFPVKEPFVNLLKSSMQTFLNALTFPDKTMYPVSSTNVADLENLMDVYLDAVLHPAIYQRPRIFEQEGWHLEYDEEADRLTYNGVVFNEMKGALSDPDDVTFMHLERALFPNSPYGFESGGHPRAIPTLTYEHFIDTHARHYNLPNSYTILYGDLDIERELAFVGERFDAAADRGAGAPNSLPLQEPVVADLTQVTMATDPKNASVSLAYVIGTAADRERVLAFDILLDALAGSNEAPLKRAVLDAGLGDDFSASLVDDLLQPQVIFMLKGAKPGVAAEFMQVVRDCCSRLVDEGVDRKRLSASLSQAEFNLRENDRGGSYSDGVALSMLSLASWLYDDSKPVDYLRYEKEIAHLREGIENGMFERLLETYVCNSTHCAAIELVPVEEGDSAAETAELAELRAGMDEAQLAAVTAEVEALREEQERPDAPEDLAKLPHLALSDIGEAPHEVAARLEEAPLPCYVHDLDTHRILYACQYFDLRCLSEDDLSYVGILTDLLGKLDIDRLDAAHLDTEVEENLGSLGFFTEAYGKDDDLSVAKPYLVVSASALSERVEQLATLPAEIWSTTHFDDLNRIRDILQQRRVSLEQRFLGAGHTAAMSHLSSYYSCAAKAMDSLSGIGYYRKIKELLASWDECAEGLTDHLRALCQRIFTADEVLVSLTGSAEDRSRYWQAGGTLGLATCGDEACAHQLQIATPEVLNEAFVIPSNVCFVACGQTADPADEGTRGLWNVATRALSYDYLWNEVRVKGGAYGCGFRHTPAKLSQFWSYRDPAAAPTVARFGGAGEWLAEWDPSEDDLTGYIVSVVASHDAPLKAYRLGRRQDSLYLAGRPEGFRDAVRAEMLAVTPEQVRGLAPVLANLGERQGLCIFGGREQIEASGLDLTVVDLLG